MQASNIVHTEQVIYMHAYNNNPLKKRGRQFEREKEGAYGTVWKEEWAERNGVTVLSSQK